eukprot:TRINITY_DN69_c0_g2_i1.p1 TRINITY_DN69_c0_g2~~TRINITY_DN69_c0_g2_i1.p1  ORF type:complete len:417 (-),score=58.87 TRINITY_DN69_c0_g2_i1:268-1353(-)
MANLDAYEAAMADAFSQGVQLIVFPEYGLTGAAFNSRDEILPYLEEIPATGGYISLLNESAALQRASALAAQYQMYMVLDLGEIEYCTAQTENCPDDGRFQYNTAVVFDNAGKLVTKYRKTHLYYEDYFNPGPGMPVFFEFRNTRIGLLICFDLQFRKPQYDLYAAGVNVLAFPTWWENSKPFTAPQAQAFFLPRWSHFTDPTVIHVCARHSADGGQRGQRLQEQRLGLLPLWCCARLLLQSSAREPRHVARHRHHSSRQNGSDTATARACSDEHMPDVATGKSRLAHNVHQRSRRYCHCPGVMVQIQLHSFTAHHCEFETTGVHAGRLLWAISSCNVGHERATVCRDRLPQPQLLRTALG